MTDLGQLPLERCKACQGLAPALSDGKLCPDCQAVDAGLTRFLAHAWGRRRIVRRYGPDLRGLATNTLLEICDEAAGLIVAGRPLEAYNRLAEATGDPVMTRLEIP